MEMTSSMDKDLTKLLARLLVAGYIIYLGFMILTGTEGSDQKIIFIIIGIFFLIADAAFIAYTIYSFIKSKKSDNE